MHILVLPSFYPTELDPICGQFFKDQALALRKHGLQVGVAYANGRSIRRGLSLHGLLTHRFQSAAGSEDGLATVRMLSWNTFGQVTWGGLLSGRLLLAAAQQYIKHYGRPDIVHVQQARWAGYGAYLLARQYGLPYVVTEHESYFEERKIPPSARSHLQAIYHGARTVMAVSRAMADAMRDVVDPTRTTIMPNMVDTQFFSPPSNPRPVEPFTFLCVARLAKIKRIDLLITAFHRTFAGDGATRLLIVGDGPEYGVLNRLTHDLGIGAQVAFTRQIPHLQVREKMRCANAFVLPSDIETFGIVLVEALASGLPVIATRCGGPEDIVTDDVGLLVARDDSVALGAALRRMRQVHQRYVPAALHAYAVRHFGEKAVVSRLLEVYRASITAFG